MERFQYRTYEEAGEQFDWNDRWKLFDGTKEQFNIAHECLDRHPPDETAVRIKFDGGETQTHTFGHLQQRSSQFAHSLKELGVGRGDVVAVMLDPREELYVGFFGTWKTGAILVPMTPLYGPDSVEYHLSDSDVDLLVTTPERAAETVPEDADIDLVQVGDEFEELLKGEPESYKITPTSATDTSVIQYTSGTTGKPEGNPMRHKSVTYPAVRAQLTYGIRSEDCCFNVAHPAHGGGLWGTLAVLSLGNAFGAYAGKFDAETCLEALEEFRITNFAASATALRRIANSGKLGEFDLAVERITGGGEKVDSNTIETFLNEIGVPIANIYGVSEFGALTSDFNGIENWEFKTGSIGKPFPGLQVAVIDDDGEKLPPDEVGEIAVWHKGDWFRTGDTGYVDDDDYFWHKAREDDVIITSGYRVDPYEVEDTLLHHDDILEAAVIGVSDSDRGNVVKAFVKTDAHETEELSDEFKEFVRSNLSKYKYPREIEFLDEFPRTEVADKIQREELREREERRVERQS